MFFQGNGGYNVDVIMCIDATGSMAPIINEVKKNALNLYDMFVEALKNEDKEVAELRVKVIQFRDYICDSEPMKESEFFKLPDQKDGFSAFVNGIEPIGGGDTPENALEAIAKALESSWTRGGGKRRHIIVVFTDAPALQIGARSGSPNYPTNLPKSMADLSAVWAGTKQTENKTFQPRAGRLILFVPKDETWTKFETWPRTVSKFTAGKGCSEIDMATVLDTVAGSFGVQ